MQGTIVKALAGFYYVESDGHIYQTRARGNFRKKGQTPYVGDQVEFSAEENSEGYILSIAPRKNSLVRPPIVNIDQAVVIMSAKEPDFNANLLDRFLVLLEHKGIHPIVYISKLDLLEDMEDIHYYQGIYQAIGYDFVLSIEELLPLLTNQTTVFMGQTGVGKSTLLNKIAPDLELETGEISDSLGRGRHTTRAVSFYHLNGGKIADTPGFSSLDYEVTTSEDLNQAFPEIADEMCIRDSIYSGLHFLHNPFSLGASIIYLLPSVIFGTLYYRSNTLLSPILAHILLNLYYTCLLYTSNLYDPQYRDLVRHISLALQANKNFIKDKDYVIPVSYTHLDVYKRQRIYCSKTIHGTSKISLPR